MKELIRTILLEYRNNIEESNIVNINKVSPNADEVTEKILYPILNDLFRGINKIKRNQFGKLTNSEKSTILEIFPNIIDRRTKEFNKNFEVTHDNSIIYDKLINIYDVKTFKGEDKKISIGLYYDNNGIAIMMDKILFLNVKKLGLNNLNNLNSTVRHELIHSADPKLTAHEPVEDLNFKDITKSYDKYVKLPYEFDSYSHEIVTTIKDNLEMIDDEKKVDIIKNLWRVIDSLKTKTKSDLYNEYGAESVIRLFTPNGVKSKNNTMLRENFWQSLNVLTAWSTKPTLYKIFYKRLARFVPYLK